LGEVNALRWRIVTHVYYLLNLALRFCFMPDHIKTLSPSLALIHQLEKTQAIVLSKPRHSLDDQSARMEKDPKKGYLFLFISHDRQFDDLPDIEEVAFTLADGRHYHIPDFRVIGYQAEIKARAPSFATDQFNEGFTGYFRYIIALNEEIDFYHTIDHGSTPTDRTNGTRCIRIDFGDLEMAVYNYSDEAENRYLVLDSQNYCSYKDFSAKEYAVRIALGYITGKFPSKEGYCFGYDCPEMIDPQQLRYSQLRPSVDSLYQPMTSNPYIVRDKKVAGSYLGQLRKLSQVEFARFCKKIDGSVDYLAAILLIIECSKSSLVVMPACFSVALEAMTDLYAADHQELFHPLPDKATANELKNDLKIVLSAYSERLSPEGRDILTAKIDRINEPTNRTKLMRPFTLLDIPLSKEDIHAVNHRNDFLHGRLNLNLADDAMIAGKRIYYIALRLYTLLAALILKSIGYDGRIINHPKFNEEDCEVKLEEEFFRQI
jgi:hypothetical protein